MKKIFSKDAFVVNKMKNTIEQNQWIIECDGLTIEEIERLGYSFSVSNDDFVSEEEYDFIQSANIEEQAFVGSSRDFVDMVLRDNQTVVFGCQKLSDSNDFIGNDKFKIYYQNMPLGDFDENRE